MAQPTKATGPLGGLRVLEISDEKIQYCGKLFADLGADVIKIEPPGGDPARRIGPFWNNDPHLERSIHFWYYNTSKWSITLNLETVDGQDLLKRLIPTTDAVLEAKPPGYLARLGLGYEELSRINNQLVMTSLTPFGQNGPWKDLKTSDLVSVALGGPAHSTGYDDHSIPPIRGGHSQGWHTGCHYAYVGTMVALLARRIYGQGQYVDSSIHEALSCTTEGASVQAMYEGREVGRQTGRHASVTPGPPSQMLCADGHYVASVSAAFMETHRWNRLVAMLEERGIAGDLTDPRYQDQAVRTTEGEHIREVLENFCKARTAEEVWRAGQAIGMYWGIVRAPHEMAEDPHHLAREFPVEVEHPELNKTFRYPGAPYKFTASPWAIRRRAPLIGEDNHEIYVKELGLKPEDLVTLFEAGII